MKITSNIVWDHRGRVPAGGVGQIEVRITVDRKSYYFGTSIRVRRSDFVAGRIVGCAGADALNDRLSIIYTKVIDIVNEALREGKAIDMKDIKRRVWESTEAVSDSTEFLTWIEKQIPMLPISDGTRKHYWPLYDRLTDFNQIRKWSDVTVENIAEFDGYLHNVIVPVSDAAAKRGLKPKKLSDAAIYNYHKCLKALLNRADSFGKIDRNPYERMKGKFKRGDRASVEYLTEDEMKAFESLLPQRGTQMETAHDLFIFQMYTGLSFSDMQKFDFRDYKKDGNRWVYTGQRVKTGVPFVGTLLAPAIRVLEKYGYSVPKIDNADYNHQLKALGVMAGIRTTLHSHLARHTFATYMLRNGAKIENVSKMLGHTNITQTQRYAKVLAESVHEDFDKIAEKINKGKTKSTTRGKRARLLT